MKDLKTCREEIDAIDKEIIALFEKRMHVAKDVITYKLAHDMQIFQKDREKEMFFCNLSKRYEINKIVREDKLTNEKKVLYMSAQTEQREKTGIEKMLAEAGKVVDDKLMKAILRLNTKFGEYHTIDMLSDTEQLIKKCRNKREKALVKDFISLWER